jgi:hypothetical protein
VLTKLSLFILVVVGGSIADLWPVRLSSSTLSLPSLSCGTADDCHPFPHRLSFSLPSAQRNRPRYFHLRLHRCLRPRSGLHDDEYRRSGASLRFFFSLFRSSSPSAPPCLIAHALPLTVPTLARRHLGPFRTQRSRSRYPPHRSTRNSTLNPPGEAGEEAQEGDRKR